jgi:hypothetical protein
MAEEKGANPVNYQVREKLTEENSSMAGQVANLQ